ncbi:hypothetical protein LOZ58_003747 [Ophidiomyces ophidiicola]|nr:hypothetical protein LOZ65_000566 [Ophidiomyces ophidiicola]KAI1942033.1 hypothetical protein LOZ66_001514 [Ophidiomyces ophidiicola]KAI1960674.1 hypothetical protein LOZ58_003747 [Ophidiomyces ophidiicola]
MPPPVQLSDDESGGESIPFDDEKSKTDKANETTGTEGSEDESEEEGGDVYVVEKIVSHEFAKKGTLVFLVKWKGYDDFSDMTKEPEENLEGAQEVLQEYFDRIGGRPEKPSKKRKSGASVQQRTPAKKSKKSPDIVNGTSDAIELHNWYPEGSNWDSQVETVETIIRKNSNLYALLAFDNGKRSKVSLAQAYEKCPQKMLRFYESNLVFKEE